VACWVSVHDAGERVTVAGQLSGLRGEEAPGSWYQRPGPVPGVRAAAAATAGQRVILGSVTVAVTMRHPCSSPSLLTVTAAGRRLKPRRPAGTPLRQRRPSGLLLAGNRARH
jgi:hypothetical protein